MKAIGKIWARLIHKGTKTLADVPAKYVDATRAGWAELYPLDDIDNYQA